MVKVSVILLNYENVKYTLPCIDSLKKQSFKDFEIIVVENGSKTGDSLELRKVKGITLIEERENWGFAEGNNIGVRKAKGEYIALLNNDTFVEKDWLKEMVTSIESDEGIGIVGSKAFNKYDQKDFTFSGYGTTTIYGLQANINVDPKTVNDFPVFAVSGGSMLFRKSEGEPFDIDYFIYHEDTAFCWLLNLKGKKAIMNPKSTLHHEGEIVIKNHKNLGNFFWYLGERNRLLNYFLYYKIGTQLVFLPGLIALEGMIILGHPGKLLQKFKGYGWLFWHIFKNIGKRRRIQSKREVGDKQVIKNMSTKILEDKNFQNVFIKNVIKGLNVVNKAWIRIFGYTTNY
tara:strand:- start:3184 stop:4215 length:1032 start_codon:yes stop_codon:yes gene_type:complete